MKNLPSVENNGVTNVDATLTFPLDSALTEMVERISDGFFALDTDWRIIYINQQSETMFGIKRECYLLRNLWESYPVLKGTVYEEKFHVALHSGVTETFERYSAKYSRWFEVSAHPSRSGLSVFFRDITRRKRAEEALQLSNERFRLAAKTDAIYDWDVVTNQLEWGEGLQALFGYSSSELQIDQWIRALHPEEGETLLADLMQSLNDPAVAVWEREYRIRHKEGQFCYASECGHILRNGEGRAVRMVGVMKNITQRKALEHQLVRQQQKTTAAVIKAQERERAQIGRDLHDNVNQILTSVKLYQELVLAGTGDCKHLVAKSIELLQDAINENRRLSRQLSAPTLGQTSLAETVQELVDTFAAARRFELTLHACSVADLPVCEDLHLGVYRILQEHLTNVSKYADASFVAVTLTVSEGALHLTIVDDGRGFDPAQKRSGIGMSNMVLRAEHLGGTLTIESAPGKGCTLTAAFPLAVS